MKAFLSRWKKVLVAIAVVALIAGILVFVLLLQWANDMVPVTAEEFSALMTAHGFEIEEVEAEEGSDADALLDRVLTARNGAYQVEYYACTSSEIASRFYYSNRNRLDGLRHYSALSSHISVGNYGNYALNSAGSYYYLARIQSTLIYVEADEAYQAEIEAIFKELGY